MGGKNHSRKGGRTARVPATRFPQIQKRMRKARAPDQGRPRKHGT